MIFSFQDVELDEERLELRRGGQRVPIEPKVLELLLHLARRSGRLVTKRELLGSVWGGVAVSDWAIARAVKEARRALRDSGRKPVFLETVRGRGYRLLVAARPVGAAGRGEDPRRGDLLVGRAPLLAELEAGLERCRRGHAELVLVSGPPGIGKTHLAMALATRAETLGFEVHTGRCVRDVGAPAGWPWIQLLRSALETSEEPLLSPGDRAVLARSLPDLADALGPDAKLLDRLPDLGPSAERFRCFDRVARLLARLTAIRPRLLVLDDLHRADPFSLQLLSFAAGALGEAPVTLLGTLRDVDAGAEVPDAASLASLATREGVRSVVLNGLDEAAVGALWRARRSDPVPPDVVRALVARTGGNPLFLEQLLRLPDPEDLPAAVRDHGVRGALGRRLEALSPGCLGLLAIGALLGDDFRLEPAATALGVDRENAAAHVDEAIHAGLVERRAGDPTLRFAHELVAEGLRESLSTAERARLHGRIAEALLALPAALQPVGSIARHLVSAVGGGDPATALAWCERAAREAAARHAYEEARSHYEQAIAMAALLPTLPAERTLSLEVEWLHSRLRCGEDDATALIETLAERARAASADAVLVEAALAREEPGLLLGGEHLRDPLVVQLLEDALEVAPEDMPLARIRLQARLARRLFYARRRERARALARDALDLATRHGDPLVEIEAISARYGVLWEPGHVEERLALARRAIEIARGVRARTWEFGGRALLAAALVEAGDVEAADAELRGLRRMGATLPWRPPGSAWIVDGAEGMLLLLRGRLRAAESAILQRLRAPDVAGRRRADFEPLVGAQLTQLRVLQGRAAEVLPLLKPLPDRLGSGWLAAVAYASAEAGLADEARAALDAVAASGFRSVFESVNWPILLASAAEACSMLGAVEHAEPLYERLRPLADAHLVLRPLVVSYGSAARTLGGLAMLLDRPREAAVHLDAALAAHQRMGAVVWTLWTQADQARLLLHRGDPEAARTLAYEVRRRCAALGLRAVEARLAALGGDGERRPDR